MTPRERLLTALNNGRPDRMPCQVHSWMDIYLENYLNGMDQWQAYEHFGMDHVVYVSPEIIYDDADLANWQVTTTDLGLDEDGVHNFADVIDTPGGQLTVKRASNNFTQWHTKHIIESEKDWEIWAKYVPVPKYMDQRNWIEARNRVGDKGIVRGYLFGFGQGSPWQNFAGVLCDMQGAIFAAMDKPSWVHAALENMRDKLIGIFERTGKMECDIVETGGGAGSSTVISPAMHKEFCLPYDKVIHKTLHEYCDVKVVYHLCGGFMPLLDLIAENGADGQETMTPPGMGGDCDLGEASRRIGARKFFVGGFDQNAGFEKGTPEKVRELVFECFEATKGHAGYICSPSDNFFSGDPVNIQAFADACKECTY